jgi:hypothetical protein
MERSLLYLIATTSEEANASPDTKGYYGYMDAFKRVAQLAQGMANGALEVPNDH